MEHLKPILDSDRDAVLLHVEILRLIVVRKGRITVLSQPVESEVLRLAISSGDW